MIVSTILPKMVNQHRLNLVNLATPTTTLKAAKTPLFCYAVIKSFKRPMLINFKLTFNKLHSRQITTLLLSVWHQFLMNVKRYLS
jgi:hypothetical protein